MEAALDHLAILDTVPEARGAKTLTARATGRFYTPPIIASQLAATAVDAVDWSCRREFRLLDPFCGDGRLLVAFIRRACEVGHGHRIHWRVACWDLDGDAVEAAADALRCLAAAEGLSLDVDAHRQDTFLGSATHHGSFDCVITNPPWEVLKPDRRELADMAAEHRIKYKASLRVIVAFRSPPPAVRSVCVGSRDQSSLAPCPTRAVTCIARS